MTSMSNDHDDDVLAAAERHDRLLQEYHKYLAKHGPLKLHSDRYCLNMLFEVLRRIKQLEKESEDCYQSRAAALLLWNELLTRLKKRLIK